MCPDCHRPVQLMASGEENWFFKLSEFQDKLLAYYEAHPDFIRPETRRNEVISFVKGGLKDLSISRSTFDWGVPLPFDTGHVACDIGPTRCWPTSRASAMPTRSARRVRAPLAPCSTTSWAQDITRFHCVIWPAMLMAADLPIATVFGHGFLLTKGEKMSKSKGNGVMPKDLVKVFGVDAYRYYFMSDVQFGSDGDISMERMVQVYNADLANTWGNLCSRVPGMNKKYFDSKVPQVPEATRALVEDNPLRELADQLYATYDACLGRVDFAGAAAAAQNLAHRANLYIDETEPFRMAKDPAKRDELAAVMYNLLEAIRIIALYMAPFTPNTAAEVYRRLGLGDITEITDIQAATAWGQLPAGNTVATGDPLFPRLDISELNLDTE